MNQFKNVFPFIAVIGVFFLASNSPMWKQMVEVGICKRHLGQNDNDCQCINKS